MAGRVAKNVDQQRNLLLRLIPLPIKTICMRTVYMLSGENKGCLNLSNMGVVTVPEAMQPLVERFEFVIGVQYTYPNNCSVATYNGKTYINMIRGIRESELDARVRQHAEDVRNQWIEEQTDLQQLYRKWSLKQPALNNAIDQLREEIRQYEEEIDELLLLRIQSTK
jgi:hypothetical protein